MNEGLELIGGQPYVSRKLLRDSGVSLDTLKGWRTQKRVEKQLLPSGLHYRYATLSDAARARLPYASLEDARLAALGVQVARATAHAQEDAHARPAQLLFDLRQAVETGWQALVTGFTHTLSVADAEPYARLQAALDWCLSPEGQAYTRQELLAAYHQLGLPVGPAGGYSLFCRKLADYHRATDKAACLLAKRGAPVQNGNAVKMGAVQKDWLINRFADFMKPSLKKTWADYKAFIKANGLDWDELSEPTVRQMLDKNRHLWEARRHGLPEAVKKVGYVLKKAKPSEPDLLIEFDGTQEPFFYRNGQGHKDGRVYSVRLWDMHSDCIVGSAYGVTEDTDLVLAAVQDYLLRQRRQPHQFRYDKGAANISQAVQDLLAATGALKFASTAKRPTARRSEKLLGQFQQQCQRDLRGFRGSNRTSDRNRDMKVHPDRLEREWKNETWESIVAQCQQAEEDWNNGVYTTDKQGATRWERYQQQGPKGRALSVERLAELLFVERQRPVRYSTQGLEIQAPNGTRYHFEPQTAPGVVDLDLHGQLAGEAPKLWVWELKNGSRELVLTRRTDGTGGWLEMGAKTAWPEAQPDMTREQQRAHYTLLTADADRKQRMKAVPTNENWRAELGPNGQSKESWNEAELSAELADAAQPERLTKRPKRPTPAKPTAPGSVGSSWFLNQLPDPTAPHLSGPLVVLD